MNNDILKIISYLNLLELPIDKPITQDAVIDAYRKLSKIYHPDVANSRYKDGKKFIELQEAKDYLLNNLSYVNNLISSGFSSFTKNNNDDAYERWKQEEDFKKRREEEEILRKQKEEEERRRQEAERRKKEEELRKRQEAERRRQEEIQRKKKLQDRKEKAIIDAQNISNNIKKEEYYEADFAKINQYILQFFNYINEDKFKNIYDIDQKYCALLESINNIKTVAQLNRIKHIKKVSLFVSFGIVALVVFLVLLVNVIIPSARYNKAIKDYEKGNYSSAEVIFTELGDYKNSNNYIAKIETVRKCQSVVNNFMQNKSELKNYNNLISDVKSVGGTIDFEYELSGGTIDKTSQFISGYYNSAQKDGYSFVSWETSSNSVDSKNGVITITLKAKYSPITYSITYNLDGGKATNVSNYTIETNTFTLNNPLKNGYVFVGWQEDGSTKIIKELSITKGTFGNKSFKAVYEPNKYTISFNTNSHSNLDNIVVTYDSNFVLPTPTKTGYLFGGWYHNGEQIVDGIWTYTSNISLTARWTTNEYLINYRLNGGTNDNSNVLNYTIEDEVVLSSPSRIGYTFIGWTSSSITSPTINPKIELGTTGDLTFIANWEANTYTISFDVNCKDVLDLDNLTVTYNQSYNLPSIYRAGYTFDGWYNGDLKFNNGEWNNTNDVTLIAKWSTISYTIIYNLNGGCNDDTYKNSYTIEDSFSVNSPTKEGYSFTGWNKNNESFLNDSFSINKGSIGNIVINANWQANTYRCHLNTNTGDELNKTDYDFIYDDSFLLPTPQKTGYLFDGWYYNESLISDEVWKISNEATLVAHWSPRDDIQYVVKHYKQNVEDDNYTLFETTILSGIADSNVLINANEYYGFTSPEEVNKIIAANGSLEVCFYYTRNKYSVSFICNGGNPLLTQELKFETPLSSFITERNKYTFGGWFSDEGLSFCEEIVSKNVIESGSIYAWWSEETKAECFNYSLNNNKCTITNYIGSNMDVVVPTYINNILVTTIEHISAKTIKSLVIPECVTDIKEAALSDCGSLESISVPFVGDKRGCYYPFAYIFGTSDYEGSILTTQYCCTRDYNIPDAYKSANNYYVPSTLKTIYITDCSYIPYGAFGGSLTVSSINISNKTNMIEWGAFEYNSSIVSLYIPFTGKSKNDSDAHYFGYIFGSNKYENNSICVPSSLKEVSINGTLNSLDPYVFYGCSSITSVCLSDSITSIGDHTFSGCSSLTSITIPDNVNVIGAKAFTYCSSLQSITIGENINNIQVNAFANCGSIKEVNISSISSWCDITFGNEYSSPLCDGADLLINGVPQSNIVLPNDVTSIKSWAFSKCSSIKTIEISESVETIKDYAFYLCTELTDVSIGNGLNKIGQEAFRDCYKLESINIPNTVTVLEGGVFFGCHSLKRINSEIDGEFIVPDSVRSIGQSAFSGCKNINKITLPFIGEKRYLNTDSNMYPLGYIFGTNAFDGSIKITQCYIENNYAQSAAYYIPQSIEEVTITDITYIPHYAFHECSNLKTINIPDEIDRIGSYAFAYCLNLKLISIPSNLKVIEEYVFLSCSSLTSIILPNDIESVSYGAFCRCSSLTTFNIPSSVTSIQNDTFSYCTSLTSIIIPDSVTSIGGAFKDCSSLETITLPFIGGSKTSDTYLGYIFGATQEQDSSFIPDSLKTVIISNGCINIGDYAFYNCSSIESIIIPNSVTSIGHYAFYNCSSLKTISFADSVISIGQYAFYNCSSLLSLIIPRCTNNIGKSAFNFCSSLESIIVDENNQYYDSRGNCNALIETSTNKLLFGCNNTSIPNTIDCIENSAFISCSALVSAIIPNGVTVIGDLAFAYCPCLEVVVIPESITLIYGQPFRGCPMLSSITVDENNSYYDSRESCNAIIKKDGNVLVCGSKNTIIPNTVTSIGDNAFECCTSLISITMPESVIKIGIEAFKGCTSLSDISLSDNTLNIDNSSFSNCPIEKAQTPGNVLFAIPKNNLKYVTITSGVLYNQSLTGAPLKTLYISSNVAGIYNGCLYGCNTIEKLIIPFVGETLNDNSNVHIGMWFGSPYRVYAPDYVPSSLKEVEFIQGIQTIRESCLSNCISLERITIPDSVTSIEDGAFEYCKSLKYIIIPSNVAKINDHLLYGCSSLEYIVLGSNVNSIEEFAFYLCSITKVYYYGLKPYTDYIEIDSTINNCNASIINSTWYYYTSNGSDEVMSGNWWYYDSDGVTIIEKIVV